jgi:hypothetical protein
VVVLLSSGVSISIKPADTPFSPSTPAMASFREKDPEMEVPFFGTLEEVFFLAIPKF